MKYTNHHILGFLEEWAPQSTKLEYDNVGLLVGNQDQVVSKVLVCLDVTPEVIEEAVTAGAELILSHHPLIFRKLSRVTSSDPVGSMIFQIVRKDISLIAAHTNLDAARGGVSFAMAEQIGLQNVRFLKENDSLSVKSDGPEENDLRNTGGTIPAGSGTEAVSGFGAFGELPAPMDARSFLNQIQTRLNSGVLRYAGHNDEISKVAVCGGSGAFLAEEAVKQHADAYVTADLKYHDFFSDSPSCMFVDAGHYESELPIVKALCTRLTDRFPDLEVLGTRVNTNPVKYYHDETPTVM